MDYDRSRRLLLNVLKGEFEHVTMAEVQAQTGAVQVRSSCGLFSEALSMESKHRQLPPETELLRGVGIHHF